MRPIRYLTGAALTLGLIVVPAVAFAQTTPNPTEPPVPFGGWTIWQAIGAMVLGAFLLFGLVAMYLRFAPTFYGSDTKPAPKRTLAPGARTAAALAIPPQTAGASASASAAPARQESGSGGGDESGA